MRFSLRQLEVFARAAQLESISAAAEALAMSQSAASAALLELERRYGRPLFDRVGKRLKLNETGRHLLPAISDLMDRATEIDAVLAGRRGPGPFRLGATQTIGNHLAPRLIETFAERHGGVRPTLEIGNTAEIASRLAEFELDLGIIEGELVHPELALEQWLGDELVLICHPEHPLAVPGSVAIDDLLANEWVVRESGSGTRQALDRTMRPYFAQWQIRLELPQIEAIIETVAVSKLIGCVSSLSIGPAMAQRRVSLLKAPSLDLRRSYYLVYHREKFLSPGIRSFLEICRELAAGSRATQVLLPTKA